MSRKGMGGDNARAEGFFGLLKREFFHARDWDGWSLGDFMAELDRWLRWFRGAGPRRPWAGSPPTSTGSPRATLCRYKKTSAVPRRNYDGLSWTTAP